MNTKTLESINLVSAFGAIRDSREHLELHCRRMAERAKQLRDAATELEARADLIDEAVTALEEAIGALTESLEEQAPVE